MSVYNREQFLEELQLRKVIRKGINVIYEKKKEVRKQDLLEESQLRKFIKKLIVEATAVPDNDPAPHKSTGINVLEDLLKKIIPVLEIDFKKLTTTTEQRESFRSHVIKATEDSLAPPKIANRINTSGAIATPDTVTEQDIDITVGDETPEDEAFIDIDPDAGKEEPEDERETFGIEGKDQTGRNMAFDSFKKINQNILDSYDLLSSEEDQNLFYDYLITNLKLYFDKFENDLGDVEEPTTDEYEQEVGGVEDTAGEEDML
jgi:hypothetical protein